MTQTSRWRGRAALLAAALAATAAVVPGTLAQECRRDEWQKVPEIFAAMGVRPGALVADVGSGDGYLTTRLAGAVGPAGRVYAVDVSSAALDRLRLRLKADGIENVTAVRSEPDDPRLPAGRLDAAVIVNAYHEMHEHHAMLTAIRTALKPDGRLVIVEPISGRRREAARADLVRAHEMTPEIVMREARSAGYRIVGLEDPFTARPHDVEWLIVLQPGDAVPVETGPVSAPDPPAARGEPAGIDDPSLRITLEEFEALKARGDVTILDVRDVRSFVRGRLPGARLLPLSDLADAVGDLKRLGTPVVTYCS